MLGSTCTCIKIQSCERGKEKERWIHLGLGEKRVREMLLMVTKGEEELEGGGELHLGELFMAMAGQGS